MMIGSMKGRAIVAAAVAVLPTAAWAHPGHGEQGSAFLAGLQHPLTGFDHMAAMLMVGLWARSEEHTSELQSLMRISYAVFCLKKKKKNTVTKQQEYN